MKKKGAGFFRGLTVPFFTYGVLNSALFGIYGNALKLIEPDIRATSREPTLMSVFLAGTISGTLLTVPINPLEVLRIKLQTHQKTEISGIKDCVHRIIKADGYRGFFKGVNTSLCRDASSYGLYFLAFEYLRRKGFEHGVENQMFVDLICGGTAGQ